MCFAGRCRGHGYRDRRERPVPRCARARRHPTPAPLEVCGTCQAKSCHGPPAQGRSSYAPSVLLAEFLFLPPSWPAPPILGRCRALIEITELGADWMLACRVLVVIREWLCVNPWGRAVSDDAQLRLLRSIGPIHRGRTATTMPPVSANAHLDCCVGLLGDPKVREKRKEQWPTEVLVGT